ncbi:extensin-3-like [Pollicipes pollicipes]|uniref:extensin-3-like n=1 Tax=Pollicipes pollicipes TaxID=41117 RepID=UPI001884B093|nr:extensin-3-like [Pollicipes pollicipes]
MRSQLAGLLMLVAACGAAKLPDAAATTPVRLPRRLPAFGDRLSAFRGLLGPFRGAVPRLAGPVALPAVRAHAGRAGATAKVPAARGPVPVFGLRLPPADSRLLTNFSSHWLRTPFSYQYVIRHPGVVYGSPPPLHPALKLWKPNGGRALLQPHRHAPTVPAKADPQPLATPELSPATSGQQTLTPKQAARAPSYIDYYIPPSGAQGRHVQSIGNGVRNPLALFPKINELTPPDKEYLPPPEASTHVHPTQQHSTFVQEQYLPPKEGHLPPPTEAHVPPPTGEYLPPPSVAQVSEPSGEYLPPPSVAQVSEPTGEYLPPPSVAQVSEPTGEYLPPPSVAQVSEPTGEYLPPPSVAQVSEPTGEYLPPPTVAQVSEPTEEYLPPPPEVQVLEPTEEYLPPPPAEHVSPPAEQYLPPPPDKSPPEDPHIPPSAAHSLPPSNPEHLELPKDEYLPPPKEQAVAPPAGEYLPPEKETTAPEQEYLPPPAEEHVQPPKKGHVPTIEKEYLPPPGGRFPSRSSGHQRKVASTTKYRKLKVVDGVLHRVNNPGDPCEGMVCGARQRCQVVMACGKRGCQGRQRLAECVSRSHPACHHCRTDEVCVLKKHCAFSERLLAPGHQIMMRDDLPRHGVPKLCE